MSAAALKTLRLGAALGCGLAMALVPSLGHAQFFSPFSRPTPPAPVAPRPPGNLPPPPPGYYVVTPGSRPPTKPAPKKKKIVRPGVVPGSPGETPSAGTVALPASPSAPEGPPPPYEPQLMRLSEIMGSLAYLRDLCGLRDGETWRLRMNALLDAEATGEGRRERLAGAYNRGYRGFEVSYRTCTPNARLVIERYVDEGGKITRDISSRYSGG